MSDDPKPPPSEEEEIAPEVRDKIIELHQHYGTRKIATRVNLSRRKVRAVLETVGLAGQSAPPASKLEPFQEIIEMKVKKGLTVSRILREIQVEGYTGGRTILSEHVRPLRKKFHQANARELVVKRRFETPEASAGECGELGVAVGHWGLRTGVRGSRFSVFGNQLSAYGRQPSAHGLQLTAHRV